MFTSSILVLSSTHLRFELLSMPVLCSKPEKISNKDQEDIRVQQAKSLKLKKNESWHSDQEWAKNLSRNLRIMPSPFGPRIGFRQPNQLPGWPNLALLCARGKSMRGSEILSARPKPPNHVIKPSKSWSGTDSSLQASSTLRVKNWHFHDTSDTWCASQPLDSDHPRALHLSLRHRVCGRCVWFARQSRWRLSWFLGFLSPTLLATSFANTWASDLLTMHCSLFQAWCNNAQP